MVVTADHVFGSRLADGLVRNGAGMVHVVRSATESRHTARSEVRDLVVVDLDLPQDTALGLIAELTRFDWHNIVAVLSSGTVHLAGAAVQHGAGALLVKIIDSVQAERPRRQVVPGVLSAQEMRTLMLVAAGCTDVMIARQIDVGTGQAKAIVRRIRQRFGARDRAHLVSKAIRARIID